MSKNILIIAAHADDEALGCGGTIARHVDAGDRVSVLFLTDGVGSRQEANQAGAQRRRNAMEQALAILGVSEHRCLDFPDNALDTVPVLEVVRALDDFVAATACPDVVYTHHAGDLNIDHQLVHRAVMTRFRPQDASGTPQLIASFEVPSSSGWFGTSAVQPFTPNLFIDISMTLARKQQALEAYAEEMRPWPHARSIEAVVHLARTRGSTVGIEAAEAFVVERMISSSQRLP